jgi:hypothetical protein
VFTRDSAGKGFPIESESAGLVSGAKIMIGSLARDPDDSPFGMQWPEHVEVRRVAENPTGFRNTSQKRPEGREIGRVAGE